MRLSILPMGRFYVILPSMQRSSPHQPITSKENHSVKYLRSLTEPKHRKKERAFLIEGIKMVEEALHARAGIKMIVAAPALVRRHGKSILKSAESQSIDI